MQKILMQEAEKYAKQNHRRRIWRKFVQAMACVVVFCTTYALILPAITMEKNPCDLEEHTHSESCYEKVVSGGAGTLVCTYESLGVHVHTQDCYNSENVLICGQADYLIHEHNEDCLDEDGTIVCQLPEVSAHVHTDDCYKIVETEPLATEAVHTHSDDCYGTEQGVLICQLTETEGHSHGENCFTLGKLVCQLTEQEGHTHGTDCYESILTCELSEEPAHQHTDECYEMVSVLVCGLEDGAILTASTNTTEPERELICTEPVAQVHTHGDSCYVSTEEDPLTCTLPEDENHTHSAICYGTWELICGKEEHTHDLVCQNDPEADVETQAQWMATFADVAMTGEWDEDLLAIARSQLGYSESTRNYEVMEDGETIKGYTRYGDWYGMPYGDWCAMFVSFCLNYADIPQDAVPYEANCPAWIEALQDEEYELYRLAGEYTPVPGDLVFFDWEEDGISDHVGIVAELVPATEEEPAKIKTIEGNIADRVAEQEYELNDETILGYGVLPPQLTEEEQAAVDRVIAMIDQLPTYEELAETLTAYEEAGDMASYEEYYIWVGQTGLRAYNAYQQLSEEQQSYVTNLDRLMELESVWSVATLVETTTTGGITAYARDTINCTNTSGKIRPILVYGYVLNHFGENATDPNTLWMAINVNESVTGRLYVDYISGYAPLANFMGWEPQYEDRDGDGIKEGFVLLTPVDYANEKQIIGYVSVGDMVTVQVNASNTSTDSNYIEYYHRSQYHTGAGLWDIFFYSAEKEEKDNSGELTIVQGADTYDLIEVNLFDYNSAINTMYNANKNYLGFQQDYGTKSIDKTNSDDFGSLSFNFGNNITEDLDAGRTDITSENATGIINRITKIDGSKLADVPISGAVEKLLSGRYPVIANFGASVDRYFHKGYENEGVVQMNTDNINGLFLYNEETGAYTFDSRENHAQFNAATNKFVLYDQIFSPNFIMYPFGNFMPLNDIVHDTVRASDCERPYLLEIANSARWKSENGYRSEYATLANVLYRYIDEMDTLYNSREWFAGNMVQKYFEKAYPDDPNETPTNLNNLLPQIYTLDYDTPSNFYFGMNMRMNLMMPKDGMTGKNNAYPMVFEFAGDDDVWVFIDGVLFLELSGIHRHVGGTIDFVNGLIHYYAFDSYVDGKIKTEPYKTETFAQVLQAAGKSTDVLNEKGTFKDYTSHTFDFFYTERGSGSSVCRMNFNFPLLKQNTISVAKELTSTTNVEMIGNPDFTFQVINADNTNPFILEGTNYTIYDTATNTQIGTGTVGANGFFTLKAGQRAEFTGISENAGQYRVREILDKDFVDQYDKFYVDGTVITKDQLTQVGGGEFRGVVSPVKDISDGSTVFTFNNHVDASKLSYLTITKDVKNVQLGYDIYFDMHVELNGKPIPVGTKYDIYTFNDFYSYIQTGVLPDPFGTYYVETEGIIPLPDGVIAWIPNLLPGTTFKIWEDSNSATGYVVGYEELWGTDYIEIYDDRAEGTVPVYDTNNMQQAHVCVRVNNTVSSLTVPFTIYKQIPNAAQDPNNAHTVTFKAKCVIAKDNSGNGNDVTSLLGTEHTQTVTIQNSTEWTPAVFIISFSDLQFTGYTLPVKLVYEITEQPSSTGEYTHDGTKYYVTFYLYKSGNKIALYKDDNGDSIFMTKADGSSMSNIGYTNYLLGNLTLEKQVVGGTVSQENGSFNFTVQIGTNGTTALQNWTVQVIKNGVSAGTAKTDTNGIINLTDIKHGDKVQLRGIPLGCVWKITETNADGYQVTWTVNGSPGSGNSVTGNIPAGGMEVVCTNTSTYVLPETGGAGTIPYTMAGLVLILFSMAYLMYRTKARGRGSYRST